MPCFPRCAYGHGLWMMMIDNAEMNTNLSRITHMLNRHKMCTIF